MQVKLNNIKPSLHDHFFYELSKYGSATLANKPHFVKLVKDH